MPIRFSEIGCHAHPDKYLPITATLFYVIHYSSTDRAIHCLASVRPLIRFPQYISIYPQIICAAWEDSTTRSQHRVGSCATRSLIENDFYRLQKHAGKGFRPFWGTDTHSRA
jgi:hypothetical protein